MSSLHFLWKQFLYCLSWMQNGQIILGLVSVIIGIAVTITHPKLYLSGFPEWIEKIQEIIPTPQKEKESEKKQ
ncbi:MAG: hypothetical protein QNJ74_01940 [Trichodesmium sp. MO_231.B1]|nr:hypothetical protein [Trichodesmium sp. MO_231.B1]